MSCLPPCPKRSHTGDSGKLRLNGMFVSLLTSQTTALSKRHNTLSSLEGNNVRITKHTLLVWAG